MKRHIEKFITVSLAGVSLIFVVSLLALVFNQSLAYQTNNTIVQALFAVFGIVFLALTGYSIFSVFSEKNTANQVLLFNNGGGAKKASVSVIKRLAKQAVDTVVGASLTSVSIFVNENNEPTLKANLVIAPKKHSRMPLDSVSVIFEKVNSALEVTFDEILGLRFKDIELKLVSAKHYKSPSFYKKPTKIIEPKIQFYNPAQYNQTIEPPIFTSEINDVNNENLSEILDIKSENPLTESLEQIESLNLISVPQTEFSLFETAMDESFDKNSLSDSKEKLISD